MKLAALLSSTILLLASVPEAFSVPTQPEKRDNSSAIALWSPEGTCDPYDMNPPALKKRQINDNNGVCEPIYL